jgi:hypothetical protein
MHTSQFAVTARKPGSLDALGMTNDLGFVISEVDLGFVISRLQDRLPGHPLGNPW